MKIRALAASGILLLSAGQALARTEIADVELDSGTGTRVEIASVFHPPPPTGYAPVRVVATNGANKDTSWSLTFACGSQFMNNSHRHGSEFGFSVPPKATQTRMLLVPVSVAYGQKGYGYAGLSMRVNLHVSGIGGEEFALHEKRVSGFPAIAISKALADNAMSRLESEVETRMRSASRGYGDNVFGSRFDSADFPEDWRGLSGFDYLMITHTEWQSLTSGARLAALQWARLGGHIHFYMAPGATAAALDLPLDALADGRTLSMGACSMIAWDGKVLPTDETVSRYWSGREREKDITATYASTFSGSSWPLLGTLGERSFASWQVLIFLVVFGILVGPVNLFVLAPASRRHRLFFTTPLLSLGASGVMITLLLFQDGIGGIGRRFVAIDLEPAETTAYVTQEQVSRTGFLVGSAFEVKHAPVLEPLALPDKPWVKLKNSADSQAAHLRQKGSQFSGNFFQSRTEQGQLVRAAIPTRARLELKAGQAAGGAPQLISALGFPAAEVFYVDAEGTVWKSTAAAGTGQIINTEKSDQAVLRTWWKNACQKAGPRTREHLAKQIERPRARFFAKSSQAPDFVLNTLKSIRWSEDEVVVFGAMPKP